MAIAGGLFKQLAYKVETTAGTAAGQSGGQLLRRVESSIDLSKDTYASNEKRPDFQLADFRHGVRKVGGSLKGELSPGTYATILGVLLKRDFAALSASASVGLTIGAATNSVYPLTRAAGSWLTDGYKVGDVIRLSVGSLNAANINKNLLIVEISSATAASVMTLNGSVLVPEGPITGCTVTLVGKKTFIPQAGHTDKSISFEHWYSDISQSELFLGCKINKASFGLPPTGIATVDFDVTGLDMADTTAKRGAIALSSQYFTTPTAVSTTGALSAVNGVLRVNGAIVATVTGLSVDVAADYKGNPVVGSNTIPQLFPGRMNVTGQLTAYFDGVTLRDAFTSESEVDLVAVFTTDNTATADFVSVVLPRIKLGGAGKNDADDGIVQTIPFQALMNSSGGATVKSEKTTFSIQDSQA